MKKEWTVRLVNWRNDAPDHTGRVPFRDTDELPGFWVEQLRYMGFCKELKDTDTFNIVEFYAPRGTDSKIWAEQNAERMQSFGLNAVAAPKWDGFSTLVVSPSPTDTPR